MERINHSIGVVDELIFVSDRHTSIAKSIRMMFLATIRSLHTSTVNMKEKFKNEDMHHLFIGAAKTFCECEFRYYWYQLVGF